MQHSSDNLGKKIESGEYYRDALRWYHTLYHSAIIERVIALIIAAASAVVIYLNLSALDVLSSNLRQEVPLIMRMQWDENKQPVLKRLSKSGEVPDVALLNYFVKEYVSVREGYNIDTLRAGFLRVRALSTPEAFAVFKSQIDLQNPESPIVRYERHTQREIIVHSVTTPVEFDKMLLQQTKENTANVVFEAQLKRGNEVIESTIWQATVAFTYKSLTVDQHSYEITPMEFIVRDYRVERLR